MVYFEDTGSVIDAPLDVVWTYLASEQHAAAHARTARNFEVRETNGSTSVIWAERLVRGRWTPFLTRSTDFPPFAIGNEEIEGTFAGTKFVVLYRPVGPRTQVDVYGDVRSPALESDEAKALFLEVLAGAYDDDLAQMRRTPSSR
jgi:hypothetical protein